MTQVPPQINIKTALSIPVISQELFSELTGFTPKTISGWIARGYIPTVKIGKRRAINLQAMSQELSL